MESSILNILQCKICIIPYDDNDYIPKVIPCGHTICKNCYKSIQDSDHYKCPFCKKDFKNNTEPVINYEIMSLIHNKRVDHSCAVHNNELLNFFCQDDKKLICQYCLLGDHMGHKIAKPEDSEISNHLKLIDEFRNYYKDIRDKKFNSNLAIKYILSKIDSAFDQFSKITHEIKNHIKYEYVNDYKKLIDVMKNIDSFEVNLLTGYNNLKDGNTFSYEEVLEEFKGLKKKYDTIKVTSDDISSNFNYKQFLTVINTLQKISEEIKNNVDFSALEREEFNGMENPVEYLLEERTSVIRYSVKSSDDHQKLISSSASKTHCVNEFVINTMKSIERREFVPSRTPYVYLDFPSKIGWNTTISAPHMHIITLNYLVTYVDKFKGQVNAIDIGCGSGYMALALAKLLGPFSKVVALDHIQEILNFAKNNINKSHPRYNEMEKIKYILREGKDGWAEGGPYQVIHVGAACETIPEPLLEQLALGGILWIPVGPKGLSKKILLVKKEEDGTIKKNELMSVNFSEMTSVEDQLQGLENHSHDEDADDADSYEENL